MILKPFEINKTSIEKNSFFLFYGKNEDYKNECLNFLISNKGTISKYEEKEILDNKEKFTEDLLSKSLFENKKIIIIRRATDKLSKIVDELISKNIEDIFIIIAANLEKKSKLRSLFEKDKKLICMPFYEDNFQTLSKIAHEFLRKENITISNSNINMIITKCNNDRGHLKNEIQKLIFFKKNGKKITQEVISKLTNLYENHSVTELVDGCLAKNKERVINILNENNFNNEDCALITRNFLNKAKKILKLTSDFKNNKNIDLTISSSKPPIFWKDKEIIKQQIFKWSPDNVKQLIYRLSEIELLIKKNINNSIRLITDFILEQVSSKNINN